VDRIKVAEDLELELCADSFKSGIIGCHDERGVGPRKSQKTYPGVGAR
jgi:hypothetical protein